jgi:hypothetical protein
MREKRSVKYCGKIWDLANNYIAAFSPLRGDADRQRGKKNR